MSPKIRGYPRVAGRRSHEEQSREHSCECLLAAGGLRWPLLAHAFMCSVRHALKHVARALRLAVNLRWVLWGCLRGEQNVIDVVDCRCLLIWGARSMASARGSIPICMLSHYFNVVATLAFPLRDMCWW